MITCQWFFLYMKPNIGSQDMWQRPINRKWKIQTGSANTKWYFYAINICVIYDIHRGVISTLVYFMGGGRGFESIPPPRYRWKPLWNENHLKSSVACALWSFFNNFTIYLFIFFIKCIFLIVSNLEKKSASDKKNYPPRLK